MMKIQWALALVVFASCTQVEYVEAPFHECGTGDGGDVDATELDAVVVFDAAPPDASLPPDAPSPPDASLPPDAPPPPPPDAAPSMPDAGPPACSASYMTGSGQHTGFVSAGQSRSYYLLLPTQTGPRPLVVVWHGTFLTGFDEVDREDMASWRAAGWIVIAPDSHNNGPAGATTWAGLPGWPGYTLPNPDPDLKLFDDLVACARARLSVDATRIYTVGHSAGGAQTNYILSQRSTLLAGGITASGLLDYTQTSPPPTIDSGMAVIVTWGGTDDNYTIGGQTVVFGPYAVASSTFWEARVHQIWCKGVLLGHRWLVPINPFMRTFLFTHPKGMSVIPGEVLPDDGYSGASCGENVATSP